MYIFDIKFIEDIHNQNNSCPILVLHCYNNLHHQIHILRCCFRHHRRHLQTSVGQHSWIQVLQLALGSPSIRKHCNSWCSPPFRYHNNLLHQIHTRGCCSHHHNNCLQPIGERHTPLELRLLVQGHQDIHILRNNCSILLRDLLGNSHHHQTHVLGCC